jgi:hypothetical protein
VRGIVRPRVRPVGPRVCRSDGTGGSARNRAIRGQEVGLTPDGAAAGPSRERACSPCFTGNRRAGAIILGGGDLLVRGSAAAVKQERIDGDACHPRPCVPTACPISRRSPRPRGPVSRRVPRFSPPCPAARRPRAPAARPPAPVSRRSSAPLNAERPPPGCSATRPARTPSIFTPTSNIGCYGPVTSDRDPPGTRPDTVRPARGSVPLNIVGVTRPRPEPAQATATLIPARRPPRRSPPAAHPGQGPSPPGA